jgi:hypothetical protein
MRKSNYIATNIPGWFRDPKTGATLNLNNDQLSIYREKISKVKEQRIHDDEMKRMEEKIGRLEALINKLVKE